MEKAMDQSCKTNSGMNAWLLSVTLGVIVLAIYGEWYILQNSSWCNFLRCFTACANEVYPSFFLSVEQSALSQGEKPRFARIQDGSQNDLIFTHCLVNGRGNILNRIVAGLELKLHRNSSANHI